MAYRNLPTLRFRHLGQREVELGTDGRIAASGFVKHYGKAISIQQWEDTCNYYSTYFPAYAAKWNARRGKAIHTRSDFGYELIRWEEKESKGIPLTAEIEAASQLQQNASAGRKLKVLLTNHQLLDFTGSEIFTFTLADSLRRLGHEVTVYSPYVDKLRQRLYSIGARVVERLDQIRGETIDLAHVHHNITALEVRDSFPLLPMLYLSHGVLPYLEQPPAIDLQITRFLAVSEEVRDALIECGVPANRVEIFRNIIDSLRFCPSARIHRTPEKALILSARIDERREQIIREACARLDIATKFIGGRFGQASPAQLPLHMNDADIVFSLGRGAIEAMMCGRIPIIFDYLGGDGMVTPENIGNLMSCNFSGRRFANEYTVDELISEIQKYKSENGDHLRAMSLELFDAQIATARLTTVYSECAETSVSVMQAADQKLLHAFVEGIRQTRAYTYNRLSRAAESSHNAEPAAVLAIPLPATGDGPPSWRESIRHLESLLWLNEQDPEAHYELGLLTYHSGNKVRALGHFQRAAALLPEDLRAENSLRILYPELVSMLLSDLGGQTEHAQNLEISLKAAEAHARNLETHTGNLEADLTRVRTHASNLEAHVSNLETHTKNLEEHARNLEDELRRLQHALDTDNLKPATSAV
jgi:glycosyltransferase involved in cell wall biosynthesis